MSIGARKQTGKGALVGLLAGLPAGVLIANDMHEQDREMPMTEKEARLIGAVVGGGIGLDADGAIGFRDFLLFAQHFGQDMGLRKADAILFIHQSSFYQPTQLTKTVRYRAKQENPGQENPEMVKAIKPVVHQFQ